MLRLAVALLTVGALGAMECPGVWETRASPPLTIGDRGADAVRLADGRLLVVGVAGGRVVSSIHDPGADAWTATTPLPLLPMPGLDESLSPGAWPEPDTVSIWPEGLTLMPDGSVVGFGNTSRIWVQGPEEVQPGERNFVVAMHWNGNTWTYGGTVADSRYNFAAARLGTGSIVLVGGANWRNEHPEGRALRYDVGTRTWSRSGGEWPLQGVDPLFRG